MSTFPNHWQTKPPLYGRWFAKHQSRLLWSVITLSLNIFYLNFMTYIHKYKMIRTEAKSLISSVLEKFNCTNVMALNQFQMLKAHKANIKETYLIEYTTTTPPCGYYSLVQMKYTLYTVSDHPQLMMCKELLQISRSLDL